MYNDTAEGGNAKMKEFIIRNRTTIVSLAVIIAVFCISAFLTAYFNEISPVGFLHF